MFKKILLAISMLMYTSNAFAEYSVWAEIGTIAVNATDRKVYVFRKDGGPWFAACNTAYLDPLQSNINGVQEFLATVFAAKMSGTDVRFTGSCSGGNFNVEQVQIK